MRSKAELDHPQSDWNLAAARLPQVDPLCCRSEWQLSCHEVFTPHRALHFRGSSDSMVCFADDPDSPHGPALMPLDADWQFGNPLLGAAAAALAAQLWRELEAGDGIPRSMLLSGQAWQERLGSRLARELGCREVRLIGQQTTCKASLAGGLDGFLARRSGKLRRNLKQAQRRAAASGLQFERIVPSSMRAAQALYRRMLAMERLSWKGAETSGLLAQGSKTFYRRLLLRLAKGRAARVLFARIDNEDVGFMFGGVAHAVYRGQQFSYHEAHHARSIGNLLQAEQVAWLCEEGVQRYDMGPYMPYKLHWTEVAEKLVSVLCLR